MKHLKAMFTLKGGSLYIAIFLWGLVGFGITPTFGSLIVHILITPFAIWAFAALCHWEGWNLAQIEAADRALEERAMAHREASHG